MKPTPKKKENTYAEFDKKHQATFQFTKTPIVFMTYEDSYKIMKLFHDIENVETDHIRHKLHSLSEQKKIIITDSIRIENPHRPNLFLFND